MLKIVLLHLVSTPMNPLPGFALDPQGVPPWPFVKIGPPKGQKSGSGPALRHTGQCKRTGGCYNELVVAFFSTGGGVKGEKIYTGWLNYLFINLHLFYLWWHLAHRPPVTLQFMALSSNWWFNSWFGLQIQQSSGVLPWQVLFLV